MLAFPFLLLAIVIAFLLSGSIGRGILTAAVAITVAYIPLYFRVIRNHVISIKERKEPGILGWTEFCSRGANVARAGANLARRTRATRLSKRSR